MPRPDHREITAHFAEIYRASVTHDPGHGSRLLLRSRIASACYLWVTTVDIAVAKIGANEIRVTLTADSQITGDLHILARRKDTRLASGSASGTAPASSPALELLTVDQVAGVLHIRRDRVYYLIRSGQLRSIMTGKLCRIARQWIAEFVRRQEIPQNLTP
jgi:excisionase family DNA binding protein